MVVGELIRQVAKNVLVSGVNALQMLPHRMNLTSKQPVLFLATACQFRFLSHVIDVAPKHVACILQAFDVIDG